VVLSVTSRAHGLVISLTLGAASTVAAYAVIVTGNVAEGTTKPEVATEQAIAARARKLDAWEASLRKALSSRPPAVPAKARYASVVLMSPPGSMALPTPVAVPPRPASEVVAVTVPHTALPPVSHPKPARASRPRAVAPTPPRREDDDRDAGGNLVPVQVAAPQPVQAAAVAPAAIQSAPVAPPAPAPSAKTSAEQQCRTILQAAENQSEKVKQAAEAQCEALKQAAERTG
jgi:hypothetical protein